VRHGASTPAVFASADSDQKDEKQKLATDYVDDRGASKGGVVRSERSVAAGCDDCGSAGKMGRQWAELRGVHDAADCADTSSSIEFQQGCRAYAQEPHPPHE